MGGEKFNPCPHASTGNIQVNYLLKTLPETFHPRHFNINGIFEYFPAICTIWMFSRACNTCMFFRALLNSASAKKHVSISSAGKPSTVLNVGKRGTSNRQGKRREKKKSIRTGAEHGNHLIFSVVSR